MLIPVFRCVVFVFVLWLVSQTADALRTKASELVDLVSYLRMFSQQEGEEWKKLPPVFWEESKLSDAAVGARCMAQA